MKSYPRVAFFTDSYHETNGVAQTSRQLEAFARREQLPFLSVRAGAETRTFRKGSVTALELRRSRIGFGIERDMRFDYLMWRHLRLAEKAVRDFHADLIHITGPSDVGQLGARLAFLCKVPLVISWHTNLHNYAGRRLEKLFSFLPVGGRQAIADWGERNSLKAVLRFYRLGRVLLAPNEELIELLKRNTGKPAYLMQRGVNTEIFSPAKRTVNDHLFRLGFVGRLSPEKNVRLLAELEKALVQAGKINFRWLIVGDGSERPWLETHLRFAEFTGVLKGEALSKAYANMDAFVFPSTTDTFGNVILEAMASGVPAVVSHEGGPKFIVQQKINGFVAEGAPDFAAAILTLMGQPDWRERMRLAARQTACGWSWDRVFERVYEAYRACLQTENAIEAQHRVVIAR